MCVMMTEIYVNVTTIMFLMSGDLTGLCLYILEWTKLKKNSFQNHWPSDFSFVSKNIKL